MVYLGVILDSTLFRASPPQPRVEKLGLIAEATDCHSAVLATPAGVFVRSIFISSIIQISYPSCGSDYGQPFSSCLFRICSVFRKCPMTFTRALLRVRLLYFSPGCISLHAALFFLFVWVHSLCFDASNEFVFIYF